MKRLASSDSTTRSTDSDDSLGEYGDPFPDPSKFNEDGSFIGQYITSVEDDMATMDYKPAYNAAF
jgi:Bravo-like intracellular region